jgi:ATP-dependent DNA helicase RecG
MIKISRITPNAETKLLLNNLGLSKGNHMTYAGSLLLGTDAARLVPGSSINCCLFHGTTKTRILDQKIYSSDFLSNYNSAVNYLLAHLDTSYEIGFKRIDKLELPETALREALLNAMGHRDYSKPGDLQVHLFQDRLEIGNPGGLVGGLTLANLGTRSIPRNPLIFGMMQRMNLVEKVGSGFKRIYNLCDKQPCPRPEIDADEDWFRIIFRRPKSGAVTQSDQVTPQVEALLRAISGEITRTELQAELNLSDRENFRLAYLKPALEANLIKRTIPDKPNSPLQKYRLTKKGEKAIKQG